jgi:hypothetical protein
MFFNKFYTIYIFKRFLLVSQGGSISYLLYDDGLREKTEVLNPSPFLRKKCKENSTIPTNMKKYKPEV